MSRGVSYFLGPILEAFGGAWSRHVVAESTENLLRFSAVYACVSRISQDIGVLRPMLMERQGNISVEVEPGASPFQKLLQRPNAYMTWVQFLSYWMVCKLLHGNAYAIIDWDNRGGEKRGIASAIYPVDPRLVRPMVASDGEVLYSFSGDQLARIPTGAAALPAEDVIHDRMNCLWHPLVGVAPIYACGASATQGVRIQNNSATFFQNMSRPSGHLSHPGTVTEEQLKLMKQQFEDGFSGGNLGRLMVTGGGAKYEPMTIPAEQAQLIEQLRWTVEDVARCFHVPLHKVQAGAAPSFSNIGALNQGYYDDCLRMHIESLEVLLTQSLMLPNRYSIELDLSGLLRMDPKTRAETMDTLVKAGILAPNEGRAREGLHPVEGGNSPMIQVQNYSLAALAKRDAQDDPFGTATPAPAAPAAPVEPDEPDEPDDDEEDDAAMEEEARAFIDTIAKGLDCEATV